MKIFSSEEARKIDGYAISDLGIPGENLMGAAGLAVAHRAKKMLLASGGENVIIICGKGNNGGDGYAAAINLNKFGVKVSLLSIVSAEDITGDAKIFHDRCINASLSCHYNVTPKNIDFQEYDLLIDGLLGTGIHGDVRANVAEWIKSVNESKKPVLSIDIPSGINSDNGQVLGVGIKADTTVTMGFLKLGLVINPGVEYAGTIEVADIGYPEKAFEIVESNKRLTDESIVKAYLQKPPSDTYKHRQGKVYFLGGSRGFTGAACLSCEAALRTGAGLVIAGIPETLNPIYETKLTEVITDPLPDTGSGRFSRKAAEYAQTKLDWCDVLAIGPGLGTDEESLQFTREIIKRFTKTMIIDADALRVFHGNLDLFQELKGRFIITPHYGEAAMLTDIKKQKIVEDPFEFIKDLSRRIGGVVVLKGAPTLIGFEDQIVVSTTGHQGLATGGSGDVLTGILAGITAQGVPLEAAAEVAVYIHGKAADILLEKRGYRGLIASDLLDALPNLIYQYECN